MASANTQAIYSRVGAVGINNTITAGNTNYDGTGGSVVVFTADATNGGRVERVRFRAMGTNVGSVGRIFINNGQDINQARNNTLWDEATLASTTASQTAALVNNEIIVGLALPPGYRLLASLGTAVAAGYAVTVVGGAY